MLLDWASRRVCELVAEFTTTRTAVAVAAALPATASSLAHSKNSKCAQHALDQVHRVPGVDHGVKDVVLLVLAYAGAAVVAGRVAPEHGH